MERPLQLELFKTKKYQSNDLNKGIRHPGLFVFIRLYEKTILLIIIFFVTSLISFSLGVNKGKRLIKQAQPEQVQLQEEQIMQSKQMLLADRLSDDKLQKKEDILKFTIQVASFKTRVYAQKEAERLEKKGLETLIIPTGNYVCVCVGNFSKRQEANLTLNQLKKTYQDCFIRRL